MLKLGETVVYCDECGVDHEALITAVWSQNCINVVYVSDIESKHDQYGRQLERASSVSGWAESWVHGRYFRTKDQPKLPYRKPEQV